MLINSICKFLKRLPVRVATMAGKAGKAGNLYEYQGIFKCDWNLIYLSSPLVEFLVT